MKKQIQYILEELNSNKYDETEQDEKYDEEQEEDFIEDEEINDEDLFEEESINEEQINIQSDIIKEYVFSNEGQNTKEINKINEFIKNKLNIADGNAKINKSNTSMIRKEELDRPLRRPTTPMTNLNNTSNSQIFNAMVDKKHSFVKNKANIPNNNNIIEAKDKLENEIQPDKENEDKDDVEDINKKQDFQEAFKSREKIVRTPPKMNK